MKLEDINYLIEKTNRSNVIRLNLLSKEHTFLRSNELYLLSGNFKGYDTSLNQLISLPSEISDLKNFSVFNNSNYPDEMVR
jgi:hypothetical protein